MNYTRGDIAIFLVMIVTSFLVLLLGTLSQRVVEQIQRNRQGLASQQAAQAANTGIEHWLQELKETGNPTGAIDSAQANVEAEEEADEWVNLENSASGVIVEYKVEYDNSSNPNVLTSTGRATTPSSEAPVRRVITLDL